MNLRNQIQAIWGKLLVLIVCTKKILKKKTQLEIIKDLWCPQLLYFHCGWFLSPNISSYPKNTFQNAAISFISDFCLHIKRKWVETVHRQSYAGFCSSYWQVACSRFTTTEWALYKMHSSSFQTSNSKKKQVDSTEILFISLDVWTKNHRLFAWVEYIFFCLCNCSPWQEENATIYVRFTHYLYVLCLFKNHFPVSFFPNK